MLKLSCCFPQPE